MKNWVIEHNDVRDNNRPNQAVQGTSRAALPPGIGILLAGVSDHVIAKNIVKEMTTSGSRVLGWCTANAAGPQHCIGLPAAREDPARRQQPGDP